MYGVWWAGAEPDVKDVGEGAKGYNALAMQHGAEPNAKVIQDILAKYVHDKGQGTGPKERSRPGALHARRDDRRCSASKACERAQERFGKGKVMTARAGALGPREPRRSTRRSSTPRLCRRDAPGQHLVRRPHGLDLGAHPDLGRREVELHVRLVPGRRADHQADGQGGRRQVRSREEAGRGAAAADCQS